jgi:hypothetical protein
MKAVLIFFSLISISALGSVQINDQLIIDSLNCSQIEKVSTQKQLETIFDTIAKELTHYTSNSRHELNKKLNDCRPTKKSKALIIAFEGTGAYQPKVPALQRIALKCLAGKIDKSLLKKINSQTHTSIAKEERIDKSKLKWSGLDTGIFESLFSMSKSREIDWYSFPSEESEALSDLEALKKYSFKQLLRDVTNSVNNSPLGIRNAVTCAINYTLVANYLGIKPKILVVTHSSGARSSVKFAEKIKSYKMKIDLVFTIDPVIEAHETLKEVLPQKIGEPARWAEYEWDRYWGRNPDYPYSRVWTRSHTNKLYKSSNIKELHSFYQQSDDLGLKIGGDALRFGIYGSKMNGADSNTLIKGLSNSGHGEIAYNKTVLDTFLYLIKNLLK